MALAGLVKLLSHRAAVPPSLSRFMAVSRPSSPAALSWLVAGGYVPRAGPASESRVATPASCPPAGTDLRARQVVHAPRPAGTPAGAWLAAAARGSTGMLPGTCSSAGVLRPTGPPARDHWAVLPPRPAGTPSGAWLSAPGLRPTCATTPAPRATSAPRPDGTTSCASLPASVHRSAGAAPRAAWSVPLQPAGTPLCA